MKTWGELKNMGGKEEERGRKGGRKGGGRAFPYVYVCFISVYGG